MSFFPISSCIRQMEPGRNGNAKKVNMFFFPHVGGGHVLPMINTARFFASHPDAQVTIITIPKNAQLIQKAIDQDHKAGLDIVVQPLRDLPKAKLKDAVVELLNAHRPDCFVTDLLYSWTLNDAANKLGIPWIVLHTTSLFVLCAEDSIGRFKPHHNVSSGTEPFVLDGLHDKVLFRRSRLPDWHANGQRGETHPLNRIRKVCQKSYAMIVNSCYELESNYHAHAEDVMGLRLLMIGPLSLSSQRTINANIRDEEESISKWLDSKKPNSVLYVSFGTNAHLCQEQLQELADGLEAAGHPFIWLARSNLYMDQEGEEGWFLEGFEKRVKDSKQGLLIKGCAPQLLILSHASVSIYMTHCAWNSSIEGLSTGVPMVTWPLMNDQFYIESFLVDVLKVGVRVGNEEYMAEPAQQKVTVTKEKVEEVVRHVMSGDEEIQEMRRRVKQYADKSKKAVEVAGSSYQTVHDLVEELKARKN